MATHTALPLIEKRTPQTRSLRGVHRWAWITLAFFIIVILEGAVVRATSSGAGCGANWPLCNGEILPHHPRLATVIEFTHRSLTGISTAMFALLIGWTFFATAKRHPARRAAVLAGLLLLGEGFLGALLVLRHLVEKNTSGERVLMQSVHFTNTLLLLAATTVTALLLRPTSHPVPTTRVLRTPALIAILSTILTGATGSLAALADTVFPSPDLRTAVAADFAANSPLLIRMRWMHPAAAALATLAALVLATYMRKNGQHRRAGLLLLNIAAQIVIGIADVLWLAPITLQVLHLLSADLFWISLVAIAAPILLPQLFQQRLA